VTDWSWEEEYIERSRRRQTLPMIRCGLLWTISRECRVRFLSKGERKKEKKGERKKEKKCYVFEKKVSFKHI
jgi:hypothetical protein